MIQFCSLNTFCYTTKENLPEELPLDKGSGAARTDVTILTYSDASPCNASGENVGKKFVDPEVIDLISLKPLDFKNRCLSA